MVTVSPQDCRIGRNLACFAERYNTNGKRIVVDRTQQRTEPGPGWPLERRSRSKRSKYGLESREEQVGVCAREAQRGADLQHFGVATRGADQNPLVSQGIDYARGQLSALGLHTHEKPRAADRPNRRMPARQSQQFLLQVAP